MKFSSSLKNSFLLFLAAAIWGLAFTAQSISMNYIKPFTFNGIRFFIGGFVLSIFLLIRSRLVKESSAISANEISKASASPSQNSVFCQISKNTLLIGGICCGLALTVASMLQQYGILYTASVGKAGFLTALYIIIVPVLGLFLKKPCSPSIGFSVLLALVGLYLISMKDGFFIEKSDLLLLLCSFFFALHILIVDYFSPRCDSVKLSCIQFFTCGIICLTIAFFLEHPSLSSIAAAWLPVLYAGVLSCGVAYTLQVVGQKEVNPTIASLILSLESAISLLGGCLILKETLTLKEGIGCGIVFAAILLAQIPFPAGKR